MPILAAEQCEGAEKEDRSLGTSTAVLRRGAGREERGPEERRPLTAKRRISRAGRERRESNIRNILIPKGGRPLRKEGGRLPIAAIFWNSVCVFKGAGRPDSETFGSITSKGSRRHNEKERRTFVRAP